MSPFGFWLVAGYNLVVNVMVVVVALAAGELLSAALGCTMLGLTLAVVGVWQTIQNRNE